MKERHPDKHENNHYLFDQGDLVYTYTAVDGRPDLKFFD